MDTQTGLMVLGLALVIAVFYAQRKGAVNSVLMAQLHAQSVMLAEYQTTSYMLTRYIKTEHGQALPLVSAMAFNHISDLRADLEAAREMLLSGEVEKAKAIVEESAKSWYVQNSVNLSAQA